MEFNVIDICTCALTRLKVHDGVTKTLSHHYNKKIICERIKEDQGLVGLELSCESYNLL